MAMQSKEGTWKGEAQGGSEALLKCAAAVLLGFANFLQNLCRLWIVPSATLLAFFVGQLDMSCGQVPQIFGRSCELQSLRRPAITCSQHQNWLQVLQDAFGRRG